MKNLFPLEKIQEIVNRSFTGVVTAKPDREEVFSDGEIEDKALRAYNTYKSRKEEKNG